MVVVDVVEVRDCPVCGEPMEKVIGKWMCTACGEADEKDESD